MEDKTFDLIEKIYSELLQFRKETTTRFDKLESAQQDVVQRLSKLEAKVEHGIEDKLQILGEQGSATTTKLDEHSLQLTNLNNKMDYLALSVNSQDKRL
ncbi:hypothetical protein EHE19_011115 [Ruminiclostridium herbifermentans]|uniref:Uncharacterized protein n=1 Tax=Ruminiclostridium herbifermentans TaxID=2488810 RepID=A0A4U7JI51_9FIRM|nr:hypothetical protein [Ruminiclostridium herbifermentans]QNU65480.1 hypothetical protein EHE19_011115 [Ruminiclostridium herbifermentans]